MCEKGVVTVLHTNIMVCKRVIVVFKVYKNDV